MGDIIADLIRAGVSPDLVGRVSEAISEARADGSAQALSSSRRANADRQARFRERKVTLHNVSNVTSPPPEVSPQEIYNQPPILTPTVEVSRAQAPEKKTAFGELSPVLGDETAAEVVDHRKRLRKPMTVNAANRLAKKFAACRDPQAAAKLMIDRGWQGFEPSWLENSSPPSPAQNNNVRQFNGKAKTPSDFLRAKIEQRRLDAERPALDLLSG